MESLKDSGGKKPDAPTNVVATNTVAGGAASISFTPSAYIGKDTITYTVTSSPGNLTATGSSSPIVVTGLTNATTYTFTVVATTNYGVQSDAASSSSLDVGIPPGAPTIGTATAGNAQATVAYTAGTAGTGATTFTATSTPGNFTGTGASPITVTGLANGTAYTFKVTASNNYGSATSGTSNSVTPVAPPYFPPYFPRSFLHSFHPSSRHSSRPFSHLSSRLFSHHSSRHNLTPGSSNKK